jgi:hypothetical protein
MDRKHRRVAGSRNKRKVMTMTSQKEIKDYVAKVLKGSGADRYLREVLGALDEHLADALKEGNATAAEMFAVSMLLVEDRLGKR